MTTQVQVAQLPAVTGTAKELLTAYDPSRFNVLQTPTLTVQEDDYELTLSAVHVNPSDKELCYPTPGKPGYVSLHAYTLMAMAAAAGLSISQSKIERNADGNVVTATCSGIVQDGPGSRRVISASYTVDIPARAEELRLAAEKKAKPEDRQRALDNLPAEVARLRRFATQLADSGAQARVIRKTLHIRSAYTIEAVARPFIISRVHFRPQDPRLRFAQEIMHQWSRESLFGPQDDDPVTTREAALARALLERADVDPLQEPPPEPSPQTYAEAVAAIAITENDDNEELTED
jgi:hypothetical protein